MVHTYNLQFWHNFAQNTAFGNDSGSEILFYCPSRNPILLSSQMPLCHTVCILLQGCFLFFFYIILGSLAAEPMSWMPLICSLSMTVLCLFHSAPQSTTWASQSLLQLYTVYALFSDKGDLIIFGYFLSIRRERWGNRMDCTISGGDRMDCITSECRWEIAFVDAPPPKSTQVES